MDMMDKAIAFPRPYPAASGRNAGLDRIRDARILLASRLMRHIGFPIRQQLRPSCEMPSNAPETARPCASTWKHASERTSISP